MFSDFGVFVYLIIACADAWQTLLLWNDMYVGLTLFFVKIIQGRWVLFDTKKKLVYLINCDINEKSELGFECLNEARRIDLYSLQ